MKLKCLDASGFGGTFLPGITTGLEYLKDKKRFNWGLQHHPQIFPSIEATTRDTKKLFAAIGKAPICTTGEFQCVVMNVYFIYNYGYANWIKHAERHDAEERSMNHKRSVILEEDVDKKTFELFHSFKGVPGKVKELKAKWKDEDDHWTERWFDRMVKEGHIVKYQYIPGLDY